MRPFVGRCAGYFAGLALITLFGIAIEQVLTGDNKLRALVTWTVVFVVLFLVAFVFMLALEKLGLIKRTLPLSPEPASTAPHPDVCPRCGATVIPPGKFCQDCGLALTRSPV